MPTEEERTEWLAHYAGYNIGLPLGPASGLCAVDIDTDDRDIISAIKAVLPPTCFERIGKKGCALLFRNPHMVSNFTISQVVDFLADGRQLVLPPSIHPETGLPYAANANLCDVVSYLPDLPANAMALVHGATAPAAETGARHNKLISHISRWRNAGLEGQNLRSAVEVWNEHRTGGEPLPSHEVEDALVWGESIKGRSVGKSRIDRETVALALTEWGIRLAHDEMRNCNTVEGLDGFGPALTDAAVNRLRMRLESETGARCGKDYFYDALADIAQERRIHPVRDYLAKVQSDWDGTARLDKWLSAYGGAEESDYTRAVGTLTLVAAVRRARQPGVKFDTMTVLEGKQGCGKSTALAILARQSDWFTDAFPFGAGPKAIVEEVGGKWIVEAGELAGLRKADHETLKAVLSRTVDICRPAYGRTAMETPRGWIVVGTTNSSAYLSDPTGNRRFLPVKVSQFDLEGLERDRDQLWAEAAVREAEGATISLPRELWNAAAREQEARRLSSPLADELTAAFGDANGQVSAREIWNFLDVPMAQRRAMGREINEVMQSLGFERIRARFGRNGSEAGYRRGDSKTLVRLTKFGVYELTAPAAESGGISGTC